MFLFLFTCSLTSIACAVCESQQPKILQGIVHGAGPKSNWDYVTVWIMVIISIITLFYAIKWLINPQENDRTHIKYSILNEQ